MWCKGYASLKWRSKIWAGVRLGRASPKSSAWDGHMMKSLWAVGSNEVLEAFLPSLIESCIHCEGCLWLEVRLATKTRTSQGIKGKTNSRLHDRKVRKIWWYKRGQYGKQRAESLDSSHISYFEPWHYWGVLSTRTQMGKIKLYLNSSDDE
jgi:hypothetical protein